MSIYAHMVTWKQWIWYTSKVHHYLNIYTYSDISNESLKATNIKNGGEQNRRHGFNKSCR